MNIRYLDISELNDRLKELGLKKDFLTAAQEALSDAKRELESHVPPTDGTDDVVILNLEEFVDSCRSELENLEADFDAAEQKELEELESLRDEIGESRGKISEDNGPFVHESDFEDYAMELADELGAIPRDASWPLTCIDWEKAARELQYDYSTVTWQGTDYLYRS